MASATLADPTAFAERMLEIEHDGGDLALKVRGGGKTMILARMRDWDSARMGRAQLVKIVAEALSNFASGRAEP